MTINILLVTKKMKLLNRYVLSQLISGYIKYFENGSRNMCFMVKDDNVLDKYNKIWGKIREMLNIKFHSMPVYDKTYIKVEVREFDIKIKTNFLGDGVPKKICIVLALPA